MTHEEANLQTKTALAASLKKFMTKKPLGKITVSEIITDCNLNRKTFYYHFCDIYDLLKWMLEQEAIEVVKNYNLLLDYEDVIHFVLQYVTDNAHILNCAYDNMGREEMKRFFYHDFISLANDIVDRCEEAGGLHVDADFKAFLSDFLTEAIAGMLVNAFKEHKTPQPDLLIRNMKIIIDTLPDMLKRAAAPQQP